MLLLEVNVEGFECFPHVDASSVSSADGFHAPKVPQGNVQTT